MNAGRMRVYADKHAYAWKARAVAYREASDYAKGWRVDPLLISALRKAMRQASYVMRAELIASERKAAA